MWFRAILSLSKVQVWWLEGQVSYMLYLHLHYLHHARVGINRARQYLWTDLKFAVSGNEVPVPSDAWYTLLHRAYLPVKVWCIVGYPPSYSTHERANSCMHLAI
jgi:hypothetical protein